MNYHDFIEKAVLTKYLSTVKLPWFGEMIELKCHSKKDTGWTCRCDCARFSLYQETMPETSTKYWVIETCGTKHKVKQLYISDGVTETLIEHL